LKQFSPDEPQKLEFLMRAVKAANCRDLRNVLAGLRPVEVSVLPGGTITASGGKTLAAQVTTDSQWRYFCGAIVAQNERGVVMTANDDPACQTEQLTKSLWTGVVPWHPHCFFQFYLLG
jgi:hypothetical protein